MNTLVLLAGIVLASSPEPRATVIVVVGAEGAPEFGRQFKTWAERWQEAARRGAADIAILGLDKPGAKDDRSLLQERLAASAGTSTGPLWLILIGHGTYNGFVGAIDSVRIYNRVLSVAEIAAISADR